MRRRHHLFRAAGRAAARRLSRRLVLDAGRAALRPAVAAAFAAGAGAGLARSVYAAPVRSRVLDLATLDIAKALGEQGLRGRFPDFTGGRPYAVVGDSHSTHLVRRDRRRGGWLAPIQLMCTGSSARGLANPDSRSGHNERVRAFLGGLPAMPVLFEFGQVDVEFVFTFRRLRDGARAFDTGAFEGFCRETVDRYLDFLAEAAPPRLRERARVVSIFPPALSDEAWRQGYVNAHIAELHGEPDPAALMARLREVEIPSWPERTSHHARFNALLRERCERSGFGFLDLFAPLVEHGAPAARFLGPSAGADHHLGWKALREPVVERLWSVAS